MIHQGILQNPSVNDGYEKQYAGCTFPDLRDKAAHVASVGRGGAISLLDISGMFWCFRQHKSMLHHQVFPIWLPGWPDWPEPRYYVLMTNAMGSTMAPAGCSSPHIILQDLANRLAPEMLTTEHAVGPEAYGLVLEEGVPWQNYLFRMHHTRQNPDPWVNLRGGSFGQFKTGGKQWTNLLHMDDNNIAGKTPELCWKRTLYLKDFYDAINIPVSEKTSPLPSRNPILTGHLGDIRKQRLGFPEPAWKKFEERLTPIFTVNPGTRFTFKDLLQAAGSAMYLADLFYFLRPCFIPFSRWLGALNRICKQDKQRWKRIMMYTAEVPRQLAILMKLGWRSAMRTRWIGVKTLLATGADASITLSADASGFSPQDEELGQKGHPAGLGLVEHETGRKSMIILPTEHPISKKPIAWLELFTAVLAIKIFARQGSVVVLYEDNMNAMIWISGHTDNPYALKGIWKAKI